MNIKFCSIIICVFTSLSLTAQAQEEIAMNTCREAAKNKAQGKIVKIELEEKTGHSYYDVDLKADDGTQWEFKCAVSDGKIFESERELPSADHPAFAALKTIDETKARAIALEAYPGTITKVEYEIEADGVATYEFDIKMTDNQVMEVEINASTGKIIKAERD